MDFGKYGAWTSYRRIGNDNAGEAARGVLREGLSKGPSVEVRRQIRRLMDQLEKDALRSARAFARSARSATAALALTINPPAIGITTSSLPADECCP